MKFKAFCAIFFVFCFSYSAKAKNKHIKVSTEIFLFTVTNKSVTQTNDQYTISGYVKESGSGENLFGVSIYVPELKLGATTNEYGFFSLSLPQGKHNILISYIGFTTQTQQIILNSNLELAIDLVPTSQSLDEVVVMADHKVKESKVTQMSSIRLNPNDVQDIPALLGEQDVLKTLQLLPGIQGGTEGSAGFFVRGGTPDQNLIVLDEAVVYNSNHLFGFFSVFNGDAIKSVEAFKGGFPARYGGRLSSVINIGMKDGNKEKMEGKINIGLISSSFVLEGPINKGKTSFIVSGRRTYADLLIQPFLPEDETGGYFFTDLNFKIHHIFSSKDKIYWSNYYGEDKFYAKFKDDTTNDRTNLGWGNITSTLRWNHQFNNKLFANTSLIFSNYKFEVKTEYEDVLSDGSIDEYQFLTSSGINDYSAKIDFDYYPNNNHSIKIGAIATRHNFVPQRVLIRDDFSGNVDTTQELNSFEGGVYVEDDWRVTDKLNISTGFRTSFFNYDAENYVNFEPRLALAYTLKPDLAFKASFASMNQYIHLLSSSGIGLPTDLWVSSTDRVKPQRSTQFAIGIAKDFQEKDYSLTVESYYKKLDDVIAYKEGASFLALDNLESGESIDWEDNITAGQGWAYGGEILFRKQTGRLTGWLGYTLSWSERQFDELNLGNKFFDRYDRRHDISLVGIYKPHEKITLSGTWVFSTGNNFTLPNLQRLNNQIAFPVFNNNQFFNQTEELSTGRNNFRGESSHRLDLGIQFHKKTKNNNTRTWGFSLYNTYARQNPFIYIIEEKDFDFDDLTIERTDENVLKRVSVLMLIPSFNYTLKF
ncbi:MAG: TonB-dependent receptor [Cellulophaga sp.]|nr:TonB-dependent receptor [Cellulophaga sp.]